MSVSGIIWGSLYGGKDNEGQKVKKNSGCGFSSDLGIFHDSLYPEHLSSAEDVTREYEIGDFGYWNAGPDLAIFYDDIYEQTIVEVIPLGHADSGAEMLAGETGTVRLELVDRAGGSQG